MVWEYIGPECKRREEKWVNYGAKPAKDRLAGLEVEPIEAVAVQARKEVQRSRQESKLAKGKKKRKEKKKKNEQVEQNIRQKHGNTH